MPYKIILPDPKTTSTYDLFISQENFRLAWERVRYFDRPDSRDWIGLKEDNLSPVFEARLFKSRSYVLFKEEEI